MKQPVLIHVVHSQQFTLLPLAFFQTFLKLKQMTKSMYFHMSERFSSYCYFKIFSCIWFLCRDRSQERLVSVLTVLCIGSNLWSSAVYSVDTEMSYIFIAQKNEKLHKVK